MDMKMQKKIERKCRRMAKEIVNEQYQLYDEIWERRIRITPQLYKHGKDVIDEIMRKMPVLFTKNPYKMAIDQAAQVYGFESESDLIDYLLAYKNRGQAETKIFNQLFDSEIYGLDPYEFEYTEENYQIDEVPF